jgi:hypothetical protein
MTAETQTKEAPATAAKPMFFNRLMTLDRELHANMKLNPEAGYGFAANTNLIPITVAEFRYIARHYPIVFSNGPIPMPFAVVGLNKDVNAMVDANGQWRTRTPIPGAVYSYPFVLLPVSKDSDELSVVIDPDAPQLGEIGAPLFEGGKATPLLDRAVQHAQMFRKGMLQTIEFGKMIVEAELLVQRGAELVLPDGFKFRIDNFLALDPEKIDKVANNIFLRWRKDGWLLPIFQYLQSLDAWTTIADVESDRRAAAAAAKA